MNFINEMPFLPLCLNRLKNPPKRLYFRGNLELLNRPKVAIVGSRKCSKYTQNLILNLANMLAKKGVCVVSGGAIGADIFAHMGSMPCTIGVFANSLDMIYPAQNEAVINEIYTKGLALSEHESTHTPFRHDFLERNRIVVGLSDAVIIAQADIKSGSMSSANHAIAMNIPVFGFPQRKGESDGTNLLISSGKMKLLDDFEKFVNSFEFSEFSKNSENSNPENSDPAGREQNSNDEILNFLAKNSDFNKSFAKFGDKLFEYEIDGKIIIDGAFVRLL